MSLLLSILFFAAGVLFTLYPILPGALFIIGGMLVYGLLEGWSEFPVWFWYAQGFLVLLNFSTDWAASLFGIKQVGGSKQAIWGSAIGILVAPFVIGPVGILIGPFVGAVIGELMHVREAGHVTRVGIASLIGFLLGSMIKFVLVLTQILLFVLRIW
jgi:uncharacterized protein YqgC (DUF456 family)